LNPDIPAAELQENSSRSRMSKRARSFDLLLTAKNQGKNEKWKKVKALFEYYYGRTNANENAKDTDHR